MIAGRNQTKGRVALILCAAAIAGLCIGTPVEAKNAAKPKSVHVHVRIVTEDDQPLKPATAYACPADQDIVNCATPITAATNPAGVATLELIKDKRYNVTAFVSDPKPRWACPGQFFNGHELYIANNPFTANATDFPKHATLVIRKPAADECAPLPVFDDLGHELFFANAFVCTLEPDGTCAPAPYPAMDRQGRLWLVVEPSVMYRLSAFIANSGWSCPGYVSPTGDTFHFGETRDVLGADLLAGISPLIIHHPSANECFPVPVFDDLGNQLSGETGAFLCRVETDGTCTSLPFPGRDADGRLLLNIDPAVTYRLGPFIINSGWPCPYILDNGDTYHGGQPIDALGADLLAGTVTLIIHHPAAAECPPPPPTAIVTVTDDTGNSLPTAGLFVCAHQPGNSTCIGDAFDGPDPDGIIRLPIDTNLVYDLGSFVANTGWPCAWIHPDDGTQFHFGPTATYTPTELLAGVTLIIHKPTAAECPPPPPQAAVPLVDDLGNIVTTGSAFVCLVEADGSCTSEPFPLVDTQGRLLINVTDPTRTLRIGPFVINSGWPCPYILDNGDTYHGSSEPHDYLGADLLAGTVTLTIHHPTAEECP